MINALRVHLTLCSDILKAKCIFTAAAGASYVLDISSYLSDVRPDATSAVTVY